nr:hypothetical protein [Streptomyces abyssomicinicus]
MSDELVAPPAVGVGGVDGETALQRAGERREVGVHALHQVAQFLEQGGVLAAHRGGDAAERAAVLLPGQRGGLGDRDDGLVITGRPAQDAAHGGAADGDGLEVEPRQPQCHFGAFGQGRVHLLEHLVELLGHPGVPHGPAHRADRRRQLGRREVLRGADHLVQEGLGGKCLRRRRRGEGDAGQQAVEQLRQPRLVTEQCHPQGASERGDLPVRERLVRLVGDLARGDRVGAVGRRFQRTAGERHVGGGAGQPAPRVRGWWGEPAIPIGAGQQCLLGAGQAGDHGHLVGDDGPHVAGEAPYGRAQCHLASDPGDREQGVRLGHGFLPQ